MGPTIPLLLFRISVASIATSLPDVQIGISMMTTVADGSKGQTDMSREYSRKIFPEESRQALQVPQTYTR